MPYQVVGVRFKKAGKVYYFDPGEYNPPVGSGVIVETARGVEYGSVVAGLMTVPDEEIMAPLKKVLRIASQEDTLQLESNREKEKKAFQVGLDKIAAHGLPMKLVGVEHTFDGNKIIFYFTADGRIDFRELVKDLAAVFRTRIELRQIGVRDEAKILGGAGLLRPGAVLLLLAGGLRLCFHPNGQGPESIPESHKDIGHLRQADVLPEI